MATLRKLVWTALVAVMLAGSLWGATAENRAYSVAAKAFQDQVWWLAESSFRQFIERFPKSEQRPEAVLYQSIARFHQTNSAGAMDLLRTNLERAGALADQYQFWIAESEFQLGDFTNAAQTYLELTRQYPASQQRLAAEVGVAASRSRLQDWAGVVAQLESPEGEFARLVGTAPTNEIVVSGLLLLGEAQLALKHYAGVEKAVAPLRGLKLAPQLAWRAARLSYEAELVSGRLPEALVLSSNLLSLADSQTELRSESVALQAAVLEGLGKSNEARGIYELNLAPGTSAPRQRQALLKLSELALSRGDVAEATNQLVKFLNVSSNEPAADVALLTLGEIQLRRSVALSTTNRVAAAGELEAALGLFNRLVETYTNSGLIGKAELDRGWCLWFKTNQLAACATAFGRAVERLPESVDRVVARFKLGDALYLQTNYAHALESYQQAVAEMARWPEWRESFGGDLCLQMLRASLAVTNTASAHEAVAQVLKLPVHGDLADRALMLAFQGMADAGDPARARKEFEEFLKQSPESPLRPEVELVIGRAREQQGEWVEAIAGYEQWMTRFPTNGLRPRVEFQLAWANWQAGHESNAYSGFTNFLTLYPTNEMAPQAQWWVADYFWRQGRFETAEINYKLLVLNWRNSPLAYEAQLKAGEAALGELRYDDARNHFTNLTSDVKCPPEIWNRAAFAYGDMLMLQPAGTNRLANFDEAIRVFDQIQQRYPGGSNETAVLAAGEAAKCWRQMGAAGITNAILGFSQVATSAVVTVAARSEAQVGLAGVYADMAQTASGADQAPLLREAIRLYLGVVYQENVHDDHESGNLRWIKRAGQDAGPLLERLGEWKAAEQLYLRMQDLLPPLREFFSRKIDQMRERQRAAEKSPARI